MSLGRYLIAGGTVSEGCPCLPGTERWHRPQPGSLFGGLVYLFAAYGAAELFLDRILPLIRILVPRW